MKRFFKSLTIIIIIIALNVLSASCSQGRDPVIARCNGLDITKSTFLLCTIEETLNIADEYGITEENIVDKSKEKALNSLRLYTYYKQVYSSANYKLDEKSRGEFRAAILASLLDAGFDYDDSNRDKAFMETFGVTFEQYMVYQEELELADYFYKKEAEAIEINKEESYEYFLENKIKFAECNAEMILLTDDTENDNIAETIKKKFTDGVSLDDIKQEFKERINKAEKLTFDSTSNINDAFGDNLLETLLVSSEGDVNVIKNNKGSVVTRTIEIKGYEENKESIEYDLKDSKYTKLLEEKMTSEEYNVTITDKELYDSIKELPKGKVK